MNMELDDLPPRYRAQAEQQLAARKRRAADPLAEAVKQAKAAGRDFDSRGEYEFYTGIVLPKMARGEIVECEQHPAFPLFPAGELTQQTTRRRAPKRCLRRSMCAKPKCMSRGRGWCALNGRTAKPTTAT